MCLLIRTDCLIDKETSHIHKSHLFTTKTGACSNRHGYDCVQSTLAHITNPNHCSYLKFSFSRYTQTENAASETNCCLFCGRTNGFVHFSCVFKESTRTTNTNTQKKNGIEAKKKRVKKRWREKRSTKYYIYCEQIVPSLTSLLLLLLLCVQTNARKCHFFDAWNWMCISVVVVVFLCHWVAFSFVSDEAKRCAGFFMLVKYALKYV